VGMALSPFFFWPTPPALFLAACLLLDKTGKWEWQWKGWYVMVQETSPSNAVYVGESQYSYIKVTDTGDLILDNLVHAHWVEGKPLDLRYEYELIYSALSERRAADQETVRALFLGGGGYVFPRYLQARWPGSSIEIAEIDPAVTAAVMGYMGLTKEEAVIVGESPEKPQLAEPVEPAGDPPFEPMRIHHLDARNHVEDLVRRKALGEPIRPFDFVYGDAFNDFSVPFHLVTKEFTAKVKELLDPVRGVYMVNIIDIYVTGQFLGAVVNTLREVFPYTYVFVTRVGGPSADEGGRQTFIVAGSLEPVDVEDIGTGLRDGETKFDGSMFEDVHLAHLAEISRGLVLTDDYSPVENMLATVVRKSKEKEKEEVDDTE
jgi:spermidine synthase